MGALFIFWFKIMIIINWLHCYFIPIIAPLKTLLMSTENNSKLFPSCNLISCYQRVYIRSRVIASLKLNTRQAGAAKPREKAYKLTDGIDPSFTRKEEKQIRDVPLNNMFHSVALEWHGFREYIKM